MEDQQQSRPCPWLVLVPFPALGHVNPMFNLARVIHSHGSFKPLLALPAFIHRHMLPADDDPPSTPSGYVEQEGVAFASIDDGFGGRPSASVPSFFEIVDALENRMQVHLEALLRSLGSRKEGLACVISDLVASSAIEVARSCGVPVVGFWPAMFATFRLLSAAPELIRRGFISDNGMALVDSPFQEVVNLPTVLTAKSLPWLVGDEAAQISRFKFWQRSTERWQSVPLIIVNSFVGEDNTRDKLSNVPSIHSIPILPLAPLLLAAASTNNIGNDKKFISFWNEDRDCLAWLSTQKTSSVIYISFGSYFGPIGSDNVREVAIGLEASGKPFLWVLRDPGREGLPDGFEERVGGRGKVVRWAPQREVLKHEAVDCFLTHCGWNSTMEAIQHGKCLVCYPLGADQILNCAYIVSVWKVGIELRGLERKFVEESLNRMMGGHDEMRERMRVLRDYVLADEGCKKAWADFEQFLSLIK